MARPKGDAAATAARREAILDAALQIFGASGYNGSSLKQVAEVVGITEAGILHHFKTKSELLLSVLEYRDDMSNEWFNDTINNSLHFQLGLALAALGVVTSLVAQHMYSMPSYAFIAKDYTTQAALYTHHQYIAIFLMCGAFAHGAIFFIRDYDPEANKNNVLARMLEHKEAIISHLSWVSLFLGFHTLGLYVHNDVVVAFGTPEKQILVEPVFAQFVQAASGKAMYGFDVLLSNAGSAASNASAAYMGGWMDAINDGGNDLFLQIGPGDFLVHHAIALGLHTTTLILVKGALDARGSKLMPDKKDFGYSFPCDGPGRGGTCQVSAWDHVFLGLFWMYNSLSIVIFHFSWKMQSDVWGTVNADGSVSHITNGNFANSAITINGWLRDFLWAQAAQVINSYGSATSAYGLMFLGAHFVWAFSLMLMPTRVSIGTTAWQIASSLT